MLDVLPESRRGRRRATTSGVISALVHVGVICAVAYASGAEPANPPAPPDGHIPVVYEPPPDGGDRAAPPEEIPPPDRCDCVPVPQPSRDAPSPAAPVDIPPTLPPAGVDTGGLVNWEIERNRAAVNGRAGGVASSGSTDAPLDNHYADKPALALEGNPAPRYPEMLRVAGVAGSVTMRFVIDTTGRVIPRTAEARHSDHDLFTAAVLAVLPRSRYLPAEANGQKVRVLVDQRFEFRLEP